MEARKVLISPLFSPRVSVRKGGRKETAENDISASFPLEISRADDASFYRVASQDAIEDMEGN